MRQSNLYIVMYAAILSVVCAGLLVAANTGLKERQQANIELEQKKNILATVMQVEEGADINQLYKDRIKEMVVDAKGNVIEGASPKDVAIAAEFKKPAMERRLPVYVFKSAENPDKVESVVFPVFGRGLWDAIWGYVSLGPDMNTIKGVKFEHKGETPGLGARITEDEIQSRYKDKEIFENGQLVSVVMMKGEGNDYSDDKHKVDGMSGATLTGKGINDMLKDYFVAYQEYMKKNKETAGTASM